MIESGSVSAGPETVAPNSGESSSGPAWDTASSAAACAASYHADLGRMQIAFHNSLPVAAGLSVQSSDHGILPAFFLACSRILAVFV